jgi:hypothetical protein
MTILAYAWISGYVAVYMYVIDIRVTLSDLAILKS